VEVPRNYNHGFGPQSPHSFRNTGKTKLNQKKRGRNGESRQFGESKVKGRQQWTVGLFAVLVLGTSQQRHPYRGA